MALRISSALQRPLRSYTGAEGLSLLRKPGVALKSLSFSRKRGPHEVVPLLQSLRDLRNG
jgi:hypothetical protein